MVVAAFFLCGRGAGQATKSGDQSPHSKGAGLLLFLAAIPLLVGCGGGLELIPVTGVVTLDGSPVDNAGIVFNPVAGGPAASGTTDAQGRFQLTTADKPGAVPGEHAVVISKQTMHNLLPDGMPGPGGIRMEYHVPQKYGVKESSGLKATVSSEQREFKFELSSK